MKRVFGSVDALDAFLQSFTMVALLGMCLIITIDVGLRYLFGNQTIWGFEVSEYMVVATAVLPAAHIHRNHAHLRVTFILDRMSPQLRKGFELFISFGLLIYSCVVLWKGSKMALQALERNAHASTAMATPLFYVEVLIPIGFAALVLAIIVDMYRSITSPAAATVKKGH